MELTSVRMKPLSCPESICSTKDDQLIVGYSSTRTIRVYSGHNSRVVCEADPRKFYSPSAVCMGKGEHSDLILVADSGTDLVHVMTMEGITVHSFRCTEPNGVCVDGNTNNVFVSYRVDREDHRIAVFEWQGSEPIRTFQWGINESNEPDTLYEPNHLWFSDELNQLFVCDSASHRIQVFTPQGDVIRAFGSYGKGNLHFKYPFGICLVRDGTLIISDRINHRIVAYKWDGKQEKFLGVFGKKGGGQGEIIYPAGVCVDSKNRLFVADTQNNRVQVFDTTSRHTRVAFLACLDFQHDEKENKPTATTTTTNRKRKINVW